MYNHTTIFNKKAQEKTRLYKRARVILKNYALLQRVH